MSNSSNAKDVFSDLLNPEEIQEIKQARKNAKKIIPDVQFIVYYVADKPNCVWQYFNKPIGGEIFDMLGRPTGKYTTYGKQYGYWIEDENKTRKFIEHTSTNCILGTIENLIDRFVPDKKCMKIFDSYEDFMVELI